MPPPHCFVAIPVAAVLPPGVPSRLPHPHPHGGHTWPVTAEPYVLHSISDPTERRSAIKAYRGARSNQSGGRSGSRNRMNRLLYLSWYTSEVRIASRKAGA